VFATARVLGFWAGGTVLVVGFGWRAGNRPAALPPGLRVGFGAGMLGRLAGGMLGRLPGGMLCALADGLLGALAGGLLGALPGGMLGRLPTGSGEVTTSGAVGSFVRFCAAAVGDGEVVAPVGGGGAVTEALADASGAVAR
jgi:hypothetical protein